MSTSIFVDTSGGELVVAANTVVGPVVMCTIEGGWLSLPVSPSILEMLNSCAWSAIDPNLHTEPSLAQGGPHRDDLSGEPDSALPRSQPGEPCERSEHTIEGDDQ